MVQNPKKMITNPNKTVSTNLINPIDFDHLLIIKNYAFKECQYLKKFWTQGCLKFCLIKYGLKMSKNTSKAILFMNIIQ